MINLMEEYIKIIKSNMNQYMKICLKNKYIKRIADSFIDTYIDIRYFGLIESKRGYTVKNKILTDLRKLKDELCLEDNRNEKNCIELSYIFIDSCIALNEKNRDEIEEEIDLIIKLRKEQFEIENEDYIKQELYQAFDDAETQKQKFYTQIDSNKFYLRFSNCKNINLKKTTLKYNIKFPSIYSIDSINKTFNSGTTKEDKLFIEYYMQAAQIIKDLEHGIYRRQYIVEFAETLLEKPQKLARLLEIINNSSIQDRMVITINSSRFDESREAIYDMIRNGYKIALKIDEKFEIDDSNIQRLSMFEYVLIDTWQKNYSELSQLKINNLIEN